MASFQANRLAPALGAALLVLLSAALPAAAQNAPVFPAAARSGAGINCGGDDYVDHKGTEFFKDMAYSTATGAGYVGGTAILTDLMPLAAGTDDQPLYAERRAGPCEYRADVPAGTYAVRLHFAERVAHGHGQCSFDVFLEGVRVLTDLDLAAIVGRDYAVAYTFAQTVTDGQLNIAIVPLEGEGAVSALEMCAVSPDGAGPAPPSAVSAAGGFFQNIVTWPCNDEPDFAGWNVYRAEDAGGPYTRVNTDLVRIRRYIDNDVAPGQDYFYRIRAVDLWGNEGGASTAVTAVPLDDSASALLIYEITISQENLDKLNEDPYADEYVPASFAFNGQTWPDVEVRYRGGVSRRFMKKSWKVNFPSSEPFGDRDKVNLKAEYPDYSLQRGKLAGDLFDYAAVPMANAEYVHLKINGTYAGVYLDYEQMDERFLENAGLDEHGNLYKCEARLYRFSRVRDYVASYEKETNESTNHSDLIHFIETLNTTTDAEFPVAMYRMLDVQRYLDWYAINILIANPDFTAHNYYLHRDPSTGIWTMLPWDLDVTFSGNFNNAHDENVIHWQTPLNLGSEDCSVKPFGGDNALITRMLRVAPFRDYLAARLAEGISTAFNPAAVYPRIDAYFGLIAFDARRDILKRRCEDNSEFELGPANLKTFVAQRGPFVLAELPAFAPNAGPYLFINEVMANNLAAVEDPDDPGTYPDWFEIYNAGVAAVDLGGMYLTNNLSNPTMWQIPAGVAVPGGGWAVFWADGETAQGDRHAGFTLNNNGGALGLFDRDGLTPIDSITYNPQPPDHVIGRLPDGSSSGSALAVWSPGEANYVPNQPPQIGGSVRVPQWPGPADLVNVTCTVANDDNEHAVVLFGRAQGKWHQKTMYDDGAHGDGSAGDGVYGLFLPALPTGTKVSYYMATADKGSLAIMTDPPEAPAACYSYVVGYVPSDLYINEFMADNGQTIEDPDEPGAYEDWIEIYNAGPVNVDLGGMYMTDDLSEPRKWCIPAGVIVPAGGFLLIWADEDLNQGDCHADFKLGKSGEAIGLFDTDANGNAEIDAIIFGSQSTDVSYGRYPDGAENWQFFSPATPGYPNQ